MRWHNGRGSAEEKGWGGGHVLPGLFSGSRLLVYIRHEHSLRLIIDPLIQKAVYLYCALSMESRQRANRFRLASQGWMVRLGRMALLERRVPNHSQHSW